MRNEKQDVAWKSMIASGLLSIGKFAVGIFTGSIGLISEGIHSLTDFIATTVTWCAVRVSDKPADDDHHFGHGKVENMAALFEILLLLMAAGWIAVEAWKHFWGETQPIIAAPAVILTLIIAMTVDFYRVRALRRVAEKTNSAALEAGALHFLSDMMSSGVVLLGMVFVLFGYPKADALAALVVALFILVTAIRLGKRSFNTLIDTAPVGKQHEITASLTRFPEVISVAKCRVRDAGAMLFIEVTIIVCRTLSLERIDQLKSHIAKNLAADYSDAEITVLATPKKRNDESMATHLRVIAANNDVAIHNLTLQQLSSHTSISLDLEVPAHFSVTQADVVATAMKSAIRDEMGAATEVDIHIEPQINYLLSSADVPKAELVTIREALCQLMQQDSMLRDIRDVKARNTDVGIVVSFNCIVQPFISVIKAHSAIDNIEMKLKALYPAISRVVGYVEPGDIEPVEALQ
ncbi:cation-efflux pump [Yersinia ruckeri]|uniref:cation-efflux pump n=1 Tax=Yersinia ruckeri TaxID=29486 RepID=UPI002237D7C3|nr:cation-efflux pump [Yersinia ruckeri]MCW6568785.1 cation-efflux pump [Yersinia ruckeri]